MAAVEDRWFDKKTGEKTTRHGQGKRWTLRWREADGRARKLSFRRKTDADAKRVEVEGDMQRGTYTDPKTGRQTFDDFAAEWIRTRTSDPMTIEQTAGRLRRYVTGTPLGKTPLAKIRPSIVQEWLSGLPLQPNTIRVIYDNVAAVLGSAVDDGILPRNPARAKSVRPPRRPDNKITPWSDEWVAAMRDQIAERYRPLVVLGAGLGLRIGESYGISPDDIDWLRGWVMIRRQVKLVSGERVFAPPKGGKSRYVPLPSAVRDELAAYLAANPARTVTLPWSEQGRPPSPTTIDLLVTNERGQAVSNRTFSTWIWGPARKRAGIPGGRENGTHALRHYYASVLLDDGESIKALAEYLGHADAGFTLRTYTHLMPSSETRTRSAVNAAFKRFSCAPDVPQWGS